MKNKFFKKKEEEDDEEEEEAGGGGGGTREKSCGKRAQAELRHSSGHSHETDRSDETSPPPTHPTQSFSPLLSLLFCFSTDVFTGLSFCLAHV